MSSFQRILTSLLFSLMAIPPVSASTLQILMHGEVSEVGEEIPFVLSVGESVSARIAVDLSTVLEPDDPDGSASFFSWEDRAGLDMEFQVDGHYYLFESALSDFNPRLASVGAIVSEKPFRDTLIFNIREENREDYAFVGFSDDQDPFEMLDGLDFPLFLNQDHLSLAALEWYVRFDLDRGVPFLGFRANITKVQFQIIPEPQVGAILLLAGLWILLIRRRRMCCA